MDDNKLRLVTTAPNPRYRHSTFPSYLKNDVKKQIKVNVKKHIIFEANQKGYSFILPLEKPKSQFSVNFDPKKFLT